MNEFSRTGLLLGETVMNTLKESTVVVFGIGGVGSHCVEALARSGIGHLVLVDNDTVSLTNINRQSIAYHSTIGQYKTQVMKTRIADICPEIRVETMETFVLPDNLDALLDNPDRSSGDASTEIRSDQPGRISYIIDAIDTVTAKLAIAEYAKKHDIPLISSMGTGNKLHAELFEITDIFKTSVCPLCRVMRRELKARGIRHLKVLYSAELPVRHAMQSGEQTAKRAIPGSVSFVPPVAGLLIAGEVIRDLAGI